MDRQQQEVNPNLINNLRSALGVLELEPSSQLYRDVVTICDHFENPGFRIAVFGPFNYGKSTLLNALLGKRTLPIDLIPTTGAAIYVRYGAELSSNITLTDGTEIKEKGTELLKQYAILDNNRCMCSDVASVTVYCSHPFLQTGVEFLDLPGTNDQQAQNTLVREQLLTADLVVQVLDCRQLMTLGERENLRDWLLDRGIETVVFVVNFLNLLAPEDQKEVYHRLRFVAESFRAKLPPNISNLYRVDALPALRARLKGDTAAAQTTGLATFESALQTIVAAQQEKTAIRLPRVLAIATELQQALEAKIEEVSTEIATLQEKHNAKLELKQKAQKLIQQGFSVSVSDFQSWLYLPKLLGRYQSEIALALQQGTFSTQETGQFQQEVRDYQQAIVDWVAKACEFFEQHSSTELAIDFLEAPQVNVPKSPSATQQSGSVTPVAVATGIGWVLGGPVGAAVVGGASYVLKKSQQKQQQQDLSTTPTPQQVTEVYKEAAKEYLTRFSKEALSNIQQYEETVAKIINFSVTTEPLKMTAQHHQLQLLQNLLANLNQELRID
ncbi:MAG: dynamin [Symploca sp. SIO2G7]|nr:dynamin [Symploca sp. SIO2G7]